METRSRTITWEDPFEVVKAAPGRSGLELLKEIFENRLPLPPISETDPPKGIGEVTMIAIVPAIVNAVAHATGHRFTELPVTATKIRDALE